MPKDHDVADALHPSVGDANGAAPLNEEGVRLPDEDAVHGPVVDVDDEVVHIPEEHAVLRVHLEPDDLGDLFEQGVTIPSAPRIPGGALKHFGLGRRRDGILMPPEAAILDHGRDAGWVGAREPSFRPHAAGWDTEGNLNDGDNFRVTADGLPLPTGSFVFYLLWAADLAQIQTKSWQI